MSAGNSNDRGILVIAFGNKRYVELAKNLSLSLKTANNLYPIALVSDFKEDDLKFYFDFLIPIDHSKGNGFSQKMWMYEYSPFQKTLFIDADCLVVRNINFLFQRLNGRPVSCIGEKVYQGSLLGTSIDDLRKHVSFQFLPTFNGGVYYFEKTDLSYRVFEFAREIFYKKYTDWGLWLFDGKPGDEPAISISMGHFSLEPISDPDRITMYTPVGQKGTFEMDILKGSCVFQKHGIEVNPAIMHFGGGYPEAFHYRREITKLKFYRFAKFSRLISSFLINLIFNPPYIIYVFFYRVAKWIFGRSKMKIFPLIPMFRFE